MHSETVLTQMRSMRLSSMADAFSSRLAAGDHNGLSHEEFVSLLINDEWQARENRKLSLMLSRTNFKPEQASLENIRYDEVRGFKKMDIMEFRTETWIHNTRNVILTGATGSGKSIGINTIIVSLLYSLDGISNEPIYMPCYYLLSIITLLVNVEPYAAFVFQVLLFVPSILSSMFG